jgi:hypothetical protein
VAPADAVVELWGLQLFQAVLGEVSQQLGVSQNVGPLFLEVRHVSNQENSESRVRVGLFNLTEQLIGLLIDQVVVGDADHVLRGLEGVGGVEESGDGFDLVGKLIA